MRTLDLGDGHIVYVDSEDWELIQGFTWKVADFTESQTFYTLAHRGHMCLLMHRLIAGAGTKEEIDHANGNGLDNRKNNLRRCTSSQNHANVFRKAGSSPYKGVFWDKSRSKWHAQIAAPEGNKRKHIGRFDSEIEAAQAYDREAFKLWGEFARLNFEEGIS